MAYSIEFLHEIRAAELGILVEKHGSVLAGSDLLEIGAGTGFQLCRLQQLTRRAVGVETPHSDYRLSESVNLVLYDGVALPFSSQSFDVIYSSHTMQHVLEEPALHKEMHRVLRPRGVAIHVVPSSAWRLWTMLAHYWKVPGLTLAAVARRRGPVGPQPSQAFAPAQRKSILQMILDALCVTRLGERGNRWTEWWHFRAASWRRRFEQLGWRVESVEPLDLFYTGYGVAAARLSIDRRRRMSGFLGSSCLIVTLKSASADHLPEP